MPDDIAAKVHQTLSRYPKRQYPKGQILVFADETPEHIFYITEGRVRQYEISYRSDEIITNIFKSPAFFPMTWALNRTPNKYSLKAETAVGLHMMPLEDARQFLQDSPGVTLDLLSRVYRGVEGLAGRLVHLMSGTAGSRLIYELIIECRRFGKPQPDGSMVLEARETDLAAHSGLSRETVSREIRNLKTVKTGGLLRLNGKDTVMADLTKLEQVLGVTV